MKTLTKAEEQIMQVLWDIGPSFLKNIVEALPQPTPHQNTVATILKILVEKEFVKINVMGRQHEYYAFISKKNYSKKSIGKLVQGYFDGSFANVVSFMVDDKKISVKELEKIITQLKKEKK